MSATIAQTRDVQLQAFSTRVADLEREMGRLTKTVQVLVSAVAPEELAALVRLQQRSPTNAELKAWAEASQALPDLTAFREERPW